MIQNVAIAQFIAYVCLTLTSIIVASVSLRFAYRQNFGWKPLLLVSTHGMESEFGEGKDESLIRLVVAFEVWNRRTYPIILDGVEVSFNQDILQASAIRLDNESPWWIAPKSRCSYMERLVVKNGEHHAYTLSALMKTDQSLDDIDDMIEVDVICFDPRRETTFHLKQKYHFHFKSVEQLKKKRRVMPRWPVRRMSK